MSPTSGDEGGLPRRSRRVPIATRRTATDETWPGANEAKTEKLRRNNLQRRARAHGLELRHSVYGYALIDSARDRVDGRNDLTLDEVESRLAPDPSGDR